MRDKKEDISYVWDMLEAAKWITKFLQGKSFYHFENDELLRSGVERKIEIIGEAARNISKEFQIHHPEIIWTKIIGLRHLLAHEYGEIKYELLWNIAFLNVPQLISLLEAIHTKEPPEENS
ncbi:MAG: HepT-like ribonuclease domain-containing protein [Candidatus Omnitrophota bacterium]